jgi:hypothetical protein
MHNRRTHAPVFFGNTKEGRKGGREEIGRDGKE